MNTHDSNSTPLFLSAGILRLLSLATGLALATAGAAVPATSPAEPKTHTLFVGADFSVDYRGKVYRVQDVIGGSFVIKVDGKDVKVPANWGAVKVKVDHSLKLTGTAVAVDNLKAERVYTPGNDPVKKFMKQQGEVMAAEDAVTASASFNATAQAMGNAESHASKGSEGGMASIYGNPMITERQMNRAGASGLSAMGRDTGILGNMQDELSQELFDALSLEFELKMTKPLQKPYVLILAEYHTPESKPGEKFNWLYATELDPVNGPTRKVRIRQGGFPPGYTLDKYQVHVYDGGEEIATNIAEKQVPLTRREAFAYLLLNYFSSHKGATVSATPAMGRLSAEEAARLTPEQRKQTYYVKVSEDGLPLATYADSSMARPADGEISSLVGDVRFYPALQNGKPAEGVAELRFSRLAL